MAENAHTTAKKPAWLRRKLPAGPACENVRNILRENQLHTVCQEAKCPNLWECFSRHTATFLILGDRCTRRCGFCNIEQGPTAPPDPAEPARVAQAVKSLGLRYVVVTSVTRDDLPDGGAAHFGATIRAIRDRVPGARVEVLIPDFAGSAEDLRAVLDARPDVLNHNVETVPRLYPAVRPGADYRRSIELLRRVRETAPQIPTKSGLMLGLGETREEVLEVLRDLRAAGCRILTLGQYLALSNKHLPVARFLPPEEFEELRRTALDMGFGEAACAPFARSSYRAGELFETANCKL